MAGSHLPGASARADSRSGSFRRTPTGDDHHRRLSTPFATLPHATRLACLREYGMHGSASDSRVGNDAFELRPDITVGDACETVAQSLRALIGTLEMLTISPDISPSCRDAIACCGLLARQVAGAFAVMAADVFPPLEEASRGDD